MSDSIISSVRANHEQLVQQYEANLPSVEALQETLVQEVLPHVTDELQLGSETVDWAREWLQDTSTMFRLLRRHQFTRSFALEAIRTILVWRINYLLPIIGGPYARILHCLPPPISDPLGRPIVIIKVSKLPLEADDMKASLCLSIERLRLHNQYLNKLDDPPTGIVLQYAFLVDLQGVSVRTFNVDLLSWLMRDLIPRYPSVIAAVFILNYSWAHASMWSVAKRVLPASALSRVFFPSRAALREYCSPNALPREYGGSLPATEDMDDPLAKESESSRVFELPDLTQITALPSSEPYDSSIVGTALTPCHDLETTIDPRSPSHLSISPMSMYNPFFGYPVISPASSDSRALAHTLQHGRRRKRDLLRTLVVLGWRRWGTQIRVLFYVVAVVLAVRTWTRGRFPSWRFAGVLGLGQQLGRHGPGDYIAGIWW